MKKEICHIFAQSVPPQFLDPSDQKTTKNNPRRPLKRPQPPPTSNFPHLSYSSGQYFTAKCPQWKLQNLILPNHTDTSEGEFNHQLVYIPAHACKHSYARARWLPQKVALADWKRFIRCWMMMKAASLVWTEKSEHCDVGALEQMLFARPPRSNSTFKNEI